MRLGWKSTVVSGALVQAQTPSAAPVYEKAHPSAHPLVTYLVSALKSARAARRDPHQSRAVLVHADDDLVHNVLLAGVAVQDDGAVAPHLAQLAVGSHLVPLARASDDDVVGLQPRARKREAVLADLGVVALAAQAHTLGRRALHQRRVLKHLRVGAVLFRHAAKRAHHRDAHHAKVLGARAEGDAVLGREEGRDGENGVGAHGPRVEALDLGNVRRAHGHLRVPQHVTVVHLVALHDCETRSRDGLLRHGAVVHEEKAAPAEEGLGVVIHRDVAQLLHVVAVNHVLYEFPANGSGVSVREAENVVNGTVGPRVSKREELGRVHPSALRVDEVVKGAADALAAESPHLHAVTVARSQLGGDDTDELGVPHHVVAHDLVTNDDIAERNDAAAAHNDGLARVDALVRVARGLVVVGKRDGARRCREERRGVRREMREAAKRVLGRGGLLNVLQLERRRHVERLPRVHVLDDAVVAQGRPQVHTAELRLRDGHGQTRETGHVQQRKRDDANVRRDEKATVRHVDRDAAGETAVGLAPRRANRVQKRLGVVGARNRVGVEHDEGARRVQRLDARECQEQRLEIRHVDGDAHAAHDGQVLQETRALALGRLHGADAEELRGVNVAALRVLARLGERRVDAANVALQRERVHLLDELDDLLARVARVLLHRHLAVGKGACELGHVVGVQDDAVGINTLAVADTVKDAAAQRLGELAEELAHEHGERRAAHLERLEALKVAVVLVLEPEVHKEQASAHETEEHGLLEARGLGIVVAAVREQLAVHLLRHHAAELDGVARLGVGQHGAHVRDEVVLRHGESGDARRRGKGRHEEAVRRVLGRALLHPVKDERLNVVARMNAEETEGRDDVLVGLEVRDVDGDEARRGEVHLERRRAAKLFVRADAANVGLDPRLGALGDAAHKQHVVALHLLGLDDLDHAAHDPVAALVLGINVGEGVLAKLGVDGVAHHAADGNRHVEEEDVVVVGAGLEHLGVTVPRKDFVADGGKDACGVGKAAEQGLVGKEGRAIHLRHADAARHALRVRDGGAL